MRAEAVIHGPRKKLSIIIPVRKYSGPEISVPKIEFSMVLDPKIKIGSVIGVIIKVIRAPGYLIPRVIAAVKALI